MYQGVRGMIQWIPPDLKDPRFKHIKAFKITGNRLEIEIDPAWRPGPPKPGRPIPPEDQR